MILWITAFHIISFTAWMAGLFYLPRLYVYHAGVAHGSDQSSLFEVMEKRLLRFITTPAMLATWFFGLWLAMLISPWSEGWFHAKLTLVIVMSAFHGYLAALRKRFVRGDNNHSAHYLKIINEVPTVLFILIVLLVILKPF
jgi:putative membrane protein